MSSRIYFVLEGPISDLGDALQTLKDTYGFAITPEFRATFSGTGFTCVVAMAQKQTIYDIQNALAAFPTISVH